MSSKTFFNITHIILYNGRGSGLGKGSGSGIKLGSLRYAEKYEILCNIISEMYETNYDKHNNIHIYRDSASGHPLYDIIVEFKIEGAHD